jgi:hypothetical protein
MLQKPLQRRSRIAQGLNVATRYASAFRSLRPCWIGFFTILSVRRHFPMWDGAAMMAIQQGGVT